MRTSLDIKTNPDLIILLHIFGVKQVYMDLLKEDVKEDLFTKGSLSDS